MTVTQISSKKHDRLQGALTSFGLEGCRALDGDAGPPATIHAVDGNGTAFLLKQQRAYLGNEEFEMHIALHWHAYEAGGPVVRPLSFAGRKMLTTALGERAEAQALIGGRSPAPNDATQLRRAAASLAQFHDSVVGFERKVRHAEPRDRFDKAGFYRQYLEGASVAPALVEALYGRLADAQSLAGLTRNASDRIYRWQMVHGDPAPSNFIVDDDGKIWIIDLDDAHWAVPAEDLAWLVCMTAALEWLPGQVPAFRLRDAWETSLLHAVMAGYADACGIARLDVDALRPWLCASLVCMVVDCFLEMCLPLVPADELAWICERAAVMVDETLDG